MCFAGLGLLFPLESSACRYDRCYILFSMESILPTVLTEVPVRTATLDFRKYFRIWNQLFRRVATTT